ncbi:hypothetical protein ON010_g6099 [Phytophthora cinnamomi]|nr:hypothetical protein ON010_g6099 [Phytophthora cinnamomi]
MAHAVVVILLVRAAIAALVLATVATAVRPTETTLRRHLRALGDLAEVAAAVRPAMAVPLRLLGAAGLGAHLVAAVLEAALVQLGALVASRLGTLGATTVAYAEASGDCEVLARLDLARGRVRLARVRHTGGDRSGRAIRQLVVAGAEALGAERRHGHNRVCALVVAAALLERGDVRGRQAAAARERRRRALGGAHDGRQTVEE